MSNSADQIAFQQISQCRPQWSGMCQVSEVLTDDKKRLLHAGPPFPRVDLIPTPVMNSLMIGAVYEGWAESYEDAKAQIIAGDILVEPAQDHNIVVPLAGVVSPTMQLMAVSDANNPERKKYSVLNEGMVNCTRLGKLDPELQSHLQWLNGPFADWVKARLVAPIELLPVITAALAEGDDCHGRTLVSSALLGQQLKQVSDQPIDDTIESFLDGALAFALNVWMAASSLLMSAAEGVVGSSVITKAAGNGYDFGVQIAAKPGEWITMAAPPVIGAIEPAHEGKKALGTIGDSAVVDFMGLGGQVLATATASFEGLKSYLPADALSRPEKALAGVLPGFGERFAATCARNVVANGAGPLVLLGMIESTGTAGRIGGGVADVPVRFFENVMQSLEA